MLNITISDTGKQLFIKSFFFTYKCSERKKDIFAHFFSADLILHSAKNIKLEIN